MKRITIDPVTRIEGHAKIDILLGDDGKVTGTEFHVTQVRGFEKFTEGPLLRNARNHSPDMRHLPGEPSARFLQGL